MTILAIVLASYIAGWMCGTLLYRTRCPHGKWHCVRCDPPEIQTMPRRR